jgi:hypothetical protein
MLGVVHYFDLSICHLAYLKNILGAGVRPNKLNRVVKKCSILDIADRLTQLNAIIQLST